MSDVCHLLLVQQYESIIAWDKDSRCKLEFYKIFTNENEREDFIKRGTQKSVGLKI